MDNIEYKTNADNEFSLISNGFIFMYFFDNV